MNFSEKYRRFLDFLWIFSPTIYQDSNDGENKKMLRFA